MEMLLSQPIRRITLLKTQVLVATVGLWGIVLSHFIGVACGIHTVSVLEAPPSPVPGLQILGALVTPENRPEPIAVALSERVQAITFIPASINLAAFGFLVFGLAAIISCCDSFRWRTIGLTVGIHVLQLVLFGISQATDRLAWLGWLTYFSAYQPQELTLHSAKSNLDNWTDIWGQTDALLAILGVGMLVVLGGVFIMVGRWQFNRRDLDPPF
jgi:ABC-type transport system involved in multi-copper enzyme maturation permease subunit